MFPDDKQQGGRELFRDNDVHTFPEAVSLSWMNLSVRVEAPENSAWLPKSCQRRQQRVVLEKVTGCVTGGSFLAVVGASGSGKTTLLAAITKRLTGRSVSGDVLFNGQPASVALLTAKCGFVPQRDLATETLTAAEHLSFMAAMLLDARTPAAGRARRVRALLADLGLSGCAHTRLRFLSGGERRRLAVAAQLLMSPPVLVLDEPCSGLDSEAARSVLEILRREADRGRAVLCTVHQVAPDALQLFSDILVLVGGRVAYHGPLQDAYHFLDRAGAKCPDGWPESLGLTGVLHQLSDPSGQRVARGVCDAFACTEQARLLSTAQVVPGGERFESLSTTVRKASWLTQFWWLVWRGMVDSRRKMKTHAIKLALFLSTSVIMAAAFVNVSPTSMVGVQGARGLMYLIISEVVFTHAYGVFHTFPGELPVFLREAQARLYSPSAYYTAKAVLMTPRSFVEPLLFLSIIYGLVDVTAGGGFVTFCALQGALFMAALVASAYGCMLSAMFKSSETTLMVTMPIDFLSLLTTGIFNTIRSLPVYLSWFKYLTAFHYGYESISILFWNNVQNINCLPDTPCLSNGNEVLEDAGFDTNDLFKDFLGMGLLVIGFHFVGFLAIFRRSRQQSTY